MFKRFILWFLGLFGLKVQVPAYFGPAEGAVHCYYTFSGYRGQGFEVRHRKSGRFNWYDSRLIGADSWHIDTKPFISKA